MAASIFKNAIFNLPKSSPIAPSLPLRPKVSRVCFTSATKYPQGGNAAEDDGRREYNADEARDEVKETMDKAKQKTQEMKDNAEDVKDKTAAKAREAKDKAAGKANEMRERSMEAAERVTDETKEKAKDAADKTKGAAGKVADTAQSVGDKAKETVQGAWGAAKETTQKIKETVVGKSDDVDDYVEDHVRKPAREHRDKVMDDEGRPGEGPK